jgi:hypothetical protein
VHEVSHPVTTDLNSLSGEVVDHPAAAALTARKDDAPAAVQAAINNVDGSSSISAGGG